MILKTPDFPAQFEKACESSKKRKIEYQGKLLAPGEDAAIIVTPDALSILLDGKPAPAGHPLMALATRHEEKIRSEMAGDLSLFCRKIAIVGRWSGDGQDKSVFEPYLLNRTEHDGFTQSRQYEYQIFPRDDAWPKVHCVVNLNRTMSGTLARRTLVSFSEAITTYPHLHEMLIGLFNLPLGVVWCPPQVPEFPILVAEWNRFTGWKDRKARKREPA